MASGKKGNLVPVEITVKTAKGSHQQVFWKSPGEAKQWAARHGKEQIRQAVQGAKGAKENPHMFPEPKKALDAQAAASNKTDIIKKSFGQGAKKTNPLETKEGWDKAVKEGKVKETVKGHWTDEWEREVEPPKGDKGTSGSTKSGKPIGAPSKDFQKLGTAADDKKRGQMAKQEIDQYSADFSKQDHADAAAHHREAGDSAREGGKSELARAHDALEMAHGQRAQVKEGRKPGEKPTAEQSPKAARIPKIPDSIREVTSKGDPDHPKFKELLSEAAEKHAASKEEAGANMPQSEKAHREAAKNATVEDSWAHEALADAFKRRGEAGKKSDIKGWAKRKSHQSSASTEWQPQATKLVKQQPHGKGGWAQKPQKNPWKGK